MPLREHKEKICLVLNEWGRIAIIPERAEASPQGRTQTETSAVRWGKGWGCNYSGVLLGALDRQRKETAAQRCCEIPSRQMPLFSLWRKQTSAQRQGKEGRNCR